MLTEVCIGEDVFREGSSGLDRDCSIQKLSDNECDPSYSKNDESTKSMDVPDQCGGQVREESVDADLSHCVEKLSVTQKLSDPGCIRDDDLSRNVDTQGVSETDFTGIPSAGDLHSIVENMADSQHLIDPFCLKNDGLSYNADRNFFSGADLGEESLSVNHMNSVSTAEELSVLKQFSELSCIKNDDFSNCLDTHDCYGVDTLEGSCTMNPASQKLPEPFSVGNNDFSDSLNGQHISRGDALGAALDSINIDEQLGQNQNGQADVTDVNGDPEAAQPENTVVSPRRWSFRKTKSRQHAQTAKSVKNGRLASRKVSLDLDLLQITRRRRSYFGKKARASVWGLLSNLELDVERNGDGDVNLTEHEKPSRSRGGQAIGKQGKNQSKKQSRKFTRKQNSRNGGISIKVKVGMGVRAASAVDATNGFEELSESMKEFADPSKEEVTKAMGFQGCKENLEKMVTSSEDTIYAAGKNFEENMATRGLDPGTSPDSEVINLNVDACLEGKGQEELHDILSSSQLCVAPGAVASLGPVKSSKKGKKLQMVQEEDCSLENELLNSEVVNSGQQVLDVGQGERAADVTYSTDASASISSVIASGNTSSTEGIPNEQLYSTVTDFEISGRPWKVEIPSMVGVELESPAPQISNKVQPHSKGKIPKCAKTKGVRKSRSEVPASANRNGCSSRKKVNEDKSPGKPKLKEKLGGGVTSVETERQTEAGNPKLSGSGESGTGNSSLTGGMSTLDVERRGLMEQFTKLRNAWVLCDDCQKWRRIPATLADQIEETNCTWTCRNNVDKNFADCSIPQEKSNAEINAELDISDVSCDEGVAGGQRKSKKLGKDQLTASQQSTWRLVKTNQFLHRNRKTQTIDEIMVCHCKPPSDGRMGCTDGCLNRMLNIECHKGTCPCGELCSNQQFQKRKYARLKMFRCGKKGYGLQVLENIAEGQFLIEYVGEVLDLHTYEARQREYALQGHKHFYFMTLNGSEVIDACAKGNLGRFINHSCDPNCRTEKWMINGEVCIGLFALRTIKKGEELTFDYNYVRVFGAAVKKCVCGSSQCRGYIGGDPQSAEVIAQDDSDDEFPEPVMVCEDSAVDGSCNEMTSVRNTFDGIETMADKGPPKDEFKDKRKPLGVQAVETETSVKVVKDKRPSVGEHAEVIEAAETEGSVQHLENLALPDAVSKPDDLSSEILTRGPELSEVEKSMKLSCCKTAALEESYASSRVSKLLLDVTDGKGKPKSATRERRIKSSKAHSDNRTSRSSSLVKKEKLKSTLVNVQRVQEMQSKDGILTCKPRKVFEVSVGRFEAVQEKLNELLNPDGGISKRKDASKGYLKLLLLTAASGDSCNGEAIQSNRDLSMILDALLKTKSRTVLVDVINKNGLQMLHNMLKRSRKEFNKIPILRKLLKVFEYLATREILMSEHINGGPTCPGVESFRESILSLTEHIDKQVHQIARNFRDRWIPRSARRHSCIDRDDCWTDFHRNSDYRFPAHKQQSDQAGKHLETSERITNSVVRSSTGDAGSSEGSCQPCSNDTRTRKRKSRWDQPDDPDPAFDVDITGDGINKIDDEFPPGFAAPLNTPVVASESCSYSFHQSKTNNLKNLHEVVTGQPQQKFISCLSVSYGVPSSIFKQVGTPHAAISEAWSVAPGMPFHPFPPLPPYPRDRRGSASNAVASSVMGEPVRVAEHDHDKSVAHNTGLKTPSSSGMSMHDVEMLDADSKLSIQQPRGPNTLGRKYFRQQKWNSSKLGPPWIRNRNNWGFSGNNSRNGLCNIGGVAANEYRTSHGWETDLYHHHHQPH